MGGILNPYSTPYSLLPKAGILFIALITWLNTTALTHFVKHSPKDATHLCLSLRDPDVQAELFPRPKEQGIQVLLNTTSFRSRDWKLKHPSDLWRQINIRYRSSLAAVQLSVGSSVQSPAI